MKIFQEDDKLQHKKVAKCLSVIVTQIESGFYVGDFNLSDVIHRFNLDGAFPQDHNVFNIMFDGTLVGGDVWTTSDGHMQANVRMKTQAFVDYVDYCFLSKHHLLLPTRIECRTSVVSQQGKILADSQVHARAVSVKVGHFATHTLQSTVSMWNDVLSPPEDVVRPLQPLTNYLVCNNTQESIRFGQAGTEENLLLRPLEAHMYAWRTHKASLQLWLCVEGLGYWRWCEPFSLAVVQPQVRKIDHGTHVTTVVISIKKLAKSRQRQASIDIERIMIHESSTVVSYRLGHTHGS